jgi:hypothetical protein
MGLAQPLPTLVNFAEQQAKLAAGYLAGTYAPPPVAEMRKIIAKDDERHTGQFYVGAAHDPSRLQRLLRGSQEGDRQGRGPGAQPGRRPAGAGAGGDQDGAVAGQLIVIAHTPCHPGSAKRYPGPRGRW